MAFCQLVNKFHSLSGKIVGSLERASVILSACVRLHNFTNEEEGPFVNAEFISKVKEMKYMQRTLNTGSLSGM
jgi:hypothetical protein